MDWREDLVARIEEFRGPGESDISLAGRGGIGPKALYSWLTGKRRPRESTWDRVTERWRQTRHLVDPARRAVQPKEGQAAVPSNAAPKHESGASGSASTLAGPAADAGGASSEGRRMERAKERLIARIRGLNDFNTVRILLGELDTLDDGRSLQPSGRTERKT